MQQSNRADIVKNKKSHPAMEVAFKRDDVCLFQQHHALG
jgi:hypothetical protein